MDRKKQNVLLSNVLRLRILMRRNSFSVIIGKCLRIDSLQVTVQQKPIFLSIFYHNNLFMVNQVLRLTKSIYTDFKRVNETSFYRNGYKPSKPGDPHYTFSKLPHRSKSRKTFMQQPYTSQNISASRSASYEFSTDVGPWIFDT